jgi:hypothetical protein
LTKKKKNDILLFLAYKMSHLGIDPGTRNIGVAITDDDGKLLFSKVYALEDDGGLQGVTEHIVELVYRRCVTSCAIERFVAFKGIHSKASEEILMLVGYLRYALALAQIPVSLYRSIEWKPALCKYLVKEFKFDNPSTKFDKIFSKAAAENITKEKIKNDHLADAIGLSRMWRVELSKLQQR